MQRNSSLWPFTRISCARYLLNRHGADTAARVYKIGFLGQTTATDLSRETGALRQGLRDLGYEEGSNLFIEYRWAERKLDRLPNLAAELVALKVDIIVTHGSPGLRAARQATGTIPIVIAVTDGARGRSNMTIAQLLCQNFARTICH